MFGYKRGDIMSIELTSKDITVFKAIKSYYSKNGLSPSYRDLMAACNEKSLSTLKHRIDRLEKLGYISHIHGVARSIKVL